MSSIRTLRTFLAAARLGSFAAAGAEVGLTAAAVGLRIRALEEDLGQELFDRGARAVVLNPTGRAIRDRVEELVRSYDALAEHDADDGTLSGKVVVGALVSALMGAFADALRAVQRDHPRLQVKLLAGLSSDFVARVECGELDAAIVTRPPQGLRPGLRWTELYTEPMVLIVPRQPQFKLQRHTIHVLSQAPFIRFDRHTWTGLLVDDVLRQCGVQSRDEMELNSVEAIIEIVRQGFGVSIVPRLANVNWRDDRALHLLKLPGPSVLRRVGLIERTSHSRSGFTQALKQHYCAPDAAAS